jgi:SAM-dependent methyltransferase
MNDLRGTQDQQNRFSAFWDRMALHYPHPFDEKTLVETRDILSLVKSKGVEIFRSTILDIGCGTGIYTLPLARYAAMVTGLDDSVTMIERLMDTVSFSGIQNVRVVKASWKDMDISGFGFEKAFDIAWTSMTPAIQTHQDFNRMEGCAKNWCVYIGWGRKRKNELMKEVFELHGLNYGPPPGVRSAYDTLVRSSRKPSLDYFETSWDWTGNIEEAMEDMVCFIEIQGGSPDRGLIEKVLDRHEREGRISHTTYAEEGLMVWRV